MENHAQRSASDDSSSSGLSSQDDDHDLAQPTTTNTTTDTRSYLPSNVSLEILQAHLDADGSDSSDASGPRVHPDFFVHLENLRRVNEANRVNARRDAEAWYEAAMGHPPQHQDPLMFNGSQHEAPQMHDQPQHDAPFMFNESQHRSSQTYSQPQDGTPFMFNGSQHEASQTYSQPQDGTPFMFNGSQHEASQMHNQPRHDTPSMFNGPQHRSSRMHDQPQHDAPFMFNESQHRSSQTYSQPQHDAPFMFNGSQHQASQTYSQPQDGTPFMFNGSQHEASQMHNQPRHDTPSMFNGSQHQASQTYRQPRNEISFTFNGSQYQVSRASNQPQNGASSSVLNQPQNGSFQFANETNQPSYHAGTGNGLQPSAMGMRERYETQDSTAAGPSEPSLHVRFATPTHIGPSHPRDNPHQRRPPSPYPVGFRRPYASGPNYMSNPPLPPYPLPSPPLPAPPVPAPPVTAPLHPDYTEHGNPYRLASEPELLPEDAITHGEERIVQSWLIRQQLIAGIPPQEIQPMAQARERQHRTPPYIMLNESGAHIIRIEPARFEGAMLPLTGLPWLPQHANSSAPASSDAPDASGLPTGQEIATGSSLSSTLNSPLDPNLSTAPNSPRAPAAANPLAGLNLATAPNSPRGLAAANSPVASHLPAPATPPTVPTLPVNSRLAATPNSPVTPDFPASRNALATTTLLATLTLRPDSTVSDPTSVPEQSSADPNEHVAGSLNPDPRMVAFFQPLRLHEPTHSVLAPADMRVEAPGTTQVGANENRQTSVATLQSPSQGGMPLTVQNYTDADSIGSPGAPGMVVSPARSQGQGSSTGTDTDNMPSPGAPSLRWRTATSPPLVVCIGSQSMGWMNRPRWADSLRKQRLPVINPPGEG
ncbi:uncharacterized protein N7518_000205 [Penicillium psychrosexuale]|uniref:uncharacterized protein n=1 Tax=Penicillium psychrosexuale TaxID=1002107 RepID=UPI0025458A64|nr:uncharacterized protein N7518_000205 [Penicillium psychrosexuale]KAJ5803902.1 hypothetical protein N7518_000205 [Penicillium psychrosexuale]